MFTEPKEDIARQGGQIRKLHNPMQFLFSAPTKAFAAGFALTALAMSNALVPGLWSDMLAFIA